MPHHRLEGNKIKIADLIRQLLAAWIPACAGMTVVTIGYLSESRH